MTANGADVDAVGGVLAERRERFSKLVALAQRSLDRNAIDEAATLAELTAFHGTWRHHGEFASAPLERLVGALAGQLGTPVGDSVHDAQAHRVLHVTSIIGGLAGLQHLIVRWIAADGDRRHDVAVTQPSNEVPAQLQRVVDASGGKVELVGDACPSAIERARRLRELAAEVDLVVLHLQTEDIVPLMAFADAAGPPTILVNHADHCFWPGASLVDLVVNLRRSGRDLCLARRGICADRLWILPTPMDGKDQAPAKHVARQSLDLPPEAPVIVSVARAPKFEARGGEHFAEIHLPVLAEHPDAHVLVVGPPPDQTWQEFGEWVGGRLRAVGPRSDVDMFLAAADIYVDSYPMVSITSLLEAGQRGLPLLSLSAHDPGSAVWSPDAPGLEGTVLVAHDVDGYRRQLSDLICDPARRSSVGAATNAAVIASHVGCGWFDSLEQLYRADLDPTRARAPGPDRWVGDAAPSVAEVDALTSKLMTANTGRDAYRIFSTRLPTSVLVRSIWIGWPEVRREMVVKEARRSVVRLATWCHLDGPLRRVRARVTRARRER